MILGDTAVRHATILLCGALLLTIPSASRLSAAENIVESADRIHAAVSEADSLYDAGSWEEAARQFEHIVEQVPNDGQSLYQLAICYHQLGKYSEAPRFYRLASSDPDYRPFCFYNMACAYSLSNNINDGLQALRDAVDNEFPNIELLLTDSDLGPLRDDDRFEAILQRAFGDGYTGFDQSIPSAKQMRAGIRHLVKTIHERHPNPYRHFSPDEWEQRADLAIARTGKLSGDGYYAELRELAGMVGDVHTSVYPRRGSSILKYSYGLRFWRFDDGLFVRAASPELAHLVGAEVLALQGIPVEEAWQRVMDMMSTENTSMSTYMTQVHLQFPAYLHALGLGSSPNGGEWTFRLSDGERQTVELAPSDSSGYLGALGTSIGFHAPEGWIQGHEELAEPPRWLKKRSDRFWFEPIEGRDAAFLQFNIPRGSDRAWREFLSEAFDTIRGRDDLSRLVIDLRHNEGGWAYMSDELLHAIVSTPKINRPGHLYILTSRITQSAGVTIAARLEIGTHAVFVGEPCGAHPNFYNGPQGNHQPIALPGSDIVFRVSTVAEQISNPLDRRCFIAPDIPAPMSHADYIAGRDPALEAALTISPDEGALHLADPGGRTIPVYFHWKRPSQATAYSEADPD